MSTPLDDDLDAFLRHGRAHGWAPATVTNYIAKLANIARFCRERGCRRSADVTPADLDALMQAELALGTAASTRRQLAALTRSLFGWLHEQGCIVRDPSRGLPLPDDGEEPLPQPPLSEAEVHALLAGLRRRSVTDLRNVCLLEMLYGCGLRRGEATRLDLDDVDLVRRTVSIHESKWGQSRIVPIMGSAATAVRDWLAVRRTLLHGPDCEAFFIAQTGKRLDGPSVAAVFWKLNARRGPEARHLHPHLFRHSIAVHLIRGGADIRHVQAFLGHADLNTTKIYLRMVPGRLKEEYDKAMPEIDVGARP
jgi:site-specific recombinase XerD